VCTYRFYVDAGSYHPADVACGATNRVRIVEWHFWYGNPLLNVDGPAFRGVEETKMWANVHNWDLGGHHRARIIIQCEYY
jgi:hypothetical protein